MKIKKCYNYKRLLLIGIIYSVIFSTFIIVFADFVITPDTPISDIIGAKNQLEQGNSIKPFLPDYTGNAIEIPQIPKGFELPQFPRIPQLPQISQPLPQRDGVYVLDKPPVAKDSTDDEGVPTIIIGSINEQYKGHPDYNTYEISLKNATYTVIENGVTVEKEFERIINGTISIKKDQSIEDLTGTENSPFVIDSKEYYAERAENLRLLSAAYPNEYEIVKSKIENEILHVNFLEFIDFYIIDDINLLVDDYNREGSEGMEKHAVIKRNRDDRVLKN